MFLAVNKRIQQDHASCMSTSPQLPFVLTSVFLFPLFFCVCFILDF